MAVRAGWLKRLVVVGVAASVLVPCVLLFGASEETEMVVAAQQQASEQLQFLHHQKPQPEPSTGHEFAASPLAVVVSTGPWRPQKLATTLTGGESHLLQLCLYSGGNVDRAASQQKSFASIAAAGPTAAHIYYITNSKPPNLKTITVPPDVEKAGYEGLPRKTLALFHQLSNTADANLANYKFVMKADDDTYVNLRVVRDLLALLDPEVPLYLGSARFGMSGGRRVPLGRYMKKGEFFREKQHYSMCHGGSGYILSRGLLRLLKGKFKRCEYEPPPTTLEDARLSFCINQHAGTQCTALEGAYGFDVLKNARTTTTADGGVAELHKMAALSPVSFAGGATYHQVLPAAQGALHAIISALERNPDVKDAAARRIERWMQNHRRAFVITWNCTAGYYNYTVEPKASTIPSPEPTHVHNHDMTHDASVRPPSSALCQGNGMPTAAKSAPTTVRMHGNEPTWFWPHKGGHPDQGVYNYSNNKPLQVQQASLHNANVILVMEGDCNHKHPGTSAGATRGSNSLRARAFSTPSSSDGNSHFNSMHMRHTNLENLTHSASACGMGTAAAVGLSLAASVLKLITSLRSAMAAPSSIPGTIATVILLFVVDANNPIWKRLVTQVETMMAPPSSRRQQKPVHSMNREDIQDNAKIIITLRLVQISESVTKLTDGTNMHDETKENENSESYSESRDPLSQPRSVRFNPERLALRIQHRRNLVFAGFLLDQPAGSIKKSLHCPPTTIFQQDPFTHIDARGGVAVFMTAQPNAYLTRSPPSVGLVKLVFGVCGPSEADTPPKWIGPGLIDSAAAIGLPVAHGLLLAVTLRRYIEFNNNQILTAHKVKLTLKSRLAKPAAPVMCAPWHVFSRVVWEGRVAEYVPVTIYTPAESPVVLASKESPAEHGDNEGVKNGRGDIAVAVLAEN